MVIIKHPSLSRKYRAKRKHRALSPMKQTKQISFIAYVCKAIAVFIFICTIPIIITILPSFLLVVTAAAIADKINQFGERLEND